MTVVTLTGHLGSMGTIAALVAQRLDSALADRELLLEAGQALGWSEDDVQAFDERTGGQGGRLTRLLRAFVERSSVAGTDPEGLGMLLASTYADTAAAEMRPRDQRYIEVLTELIHSLHERGNVVIVGRGGQAVLAGKEDVVHVRVVCDPDERIRRISSRDEMTLEAARGRVEDSDRQREAWHQKYFGIDYRSPYLYHLVVNSGWVSDETAADLIVRLVEALRPRAEPAAAEVTPA